MRVTRICGGSEESDASIGSVRAAIVVVAPPQTQAFPFNTIFGDRLQTGQVNNQFKDLLLKSAILNRMTHLGMPDSVKVSG